MAAILTCGRPECRISNTGICAEGHTPVEACPSFGKAELDAQQELDEEFEDEDSEEVDDQLVAESARMPLLSGESLVPAEVDRFLLRKPAKFVTIVGEFDSGKTTLICALYDRFLKGGFAGYLFSGSHTLLGFEKRSHHSRVDSGRIAPSEHQADVPGQLQWRRRSPAEWNNGAGRPLHPQQPRTDDRGHGRAGQW